MFVVRVKNLLPFLEKKIVVIKPEYEEELRERGYELIKIERGDNIPEDAGTVIIDIEELPEDKELKEFLGKVESSNVKFLIICGKNKINVEELLKSIQTFQLGRKTEDLIVLFRKPEKMGKKVIDSEPW